MSLFTILIIVLAVVLVLSLPGIGPFQHNYGYFPGGVLGIVLIILVVLLLTGRL